jgi:hypothetical protein
MNIPGSHRRHDFQRQKRYLAMAGRNGSQYGELPKVLFDQCSGRS